MLLVALENQVGVVDEDDGRRILPGGFKNFADLAIEAAGTRDDGAVDQKELGSSTEHAGVLPVGAVVQSQDAAVP